MTSITEVLASLLNKDLCKDWSPVNTGAPGPRQVLEESKRVLNRFTWVHGM